MEVVGVLSDNGDPLNRIICCLICESRPSHGLGALGKAPPAPASVNQGVVMSSGMSLLFSL
jgi:hypothetical protein